MFASAPPYPQNPLPAPGSDQVLTLDPGNNNGCATEPAGADGPGSFGWARDHGGKLQPAGQRRHFPARMQVRVSCGLPGGLQNAQQSQMPILVPVYVSLNNAAGNTYVLKGFADFVVTGYNLPGFAAAGLAEPG